MIAVLTDIHGNSVALDAAIDDARRAGAERWWLLGDLVAMGPDPVGTVTRLRKLNAEVRILGNTERYVLRGELPFAPTGELELTAALVDQMVETAASFAWTRGRLMDDDLTWLADGVPAARRSLADGIEVLAVHASQVADDGPGISPEIVDVELAALFSDEDVDLIVAGHTHRVTDRSMRAQRFANPGSVSNHVEGERVAKYLLIDDVPDGHTLEFRRVEYDVDRVIEQIRSVGIPGERFLLDTYFG